MIFSEMHFRNYFHKVLVFEVDDLTECFRDQTDVTIEDCYMACSNYINEEGELVFFALAIGGRKDQCDKAVYKEFDAYMMDEYEAYPCDSFTLNEIAKEYIADKEAENFTMYQLRKIEMIDELRYPYKPDLVPVCFFNNHMEEQHYVKLNGFKSNFLQGELVDEVSEDYPYKTGDLVLVIPCMINNQMQLVSMNDSAMEFGEQIIEDLVKMFDSMVLEKDSEPSRRS